MKHNSFFLFHFVFMWLLQPAAQAQLADTNRIIVADGFIEKMDNNIIFKVGLNNKYESFSQKIGDSYEIKLYPNLATNFNVSIDYKFISASFQIAPDFFPGNGDNEKYGKTKAFSIGMATIFRHWAVGVNVNRVRGYYLQNTPDLNLEWQKGDPYISLPDYETFTVLANIGYSFNPRISLRSVTSFTERQLKSAGSFMPNFHFKVIKMDAHSNLARGSFNPRNNIYEAVIGPSYFHIFVFKANYFVLVGGNAGIGFVNWKASNQKKGGITEESQQLDFAYRWDAKAGIGYNGRSFFTGLYVTLGDLYFAQDYEVKNMQQNFEAYFQFLIGIRLEAPSWLKKQMARLDEKIKL